jgi:uncharacterized protein (TIGR02145 family)
MNSPHGEILTDYYQNHIVTQADSKMKKQTNFQPITTLIILIFITNVNQIYGQVTIGSGIEPIQGALLDLKEVQQNDGSANSTKGLMLPRVELTDLNNLYPMFAAGYDAMENAKHTGLIVYNIHEDACAGIPRGVFVWNGSQWQALGNGSDGSGSPTRVISLTDTRDGNQYLAGKFGDAGWWFLESLRYMPTDGSVALSTTSDTYTTKSFYYPDGKPENTYGNPPVSWEPRQGLLYSWTAATNGQNLSEVNQGQVPGTVPGPEEVETLYESAAGAKNGKIQGLCPVGWHVPSDRDWNQLEKEIYQHAEEYSHYTLAERETFNNAIPWDNIWETRPAALYPHMRPEYPPSGDGQGRAIRSQDQLPGGNIPDGLSLPAADGGFDALLTASANLPDRGESAVQWGAKFQAWSSSRQSTDYQNNPVNVRWFREIEATGGGVTRDVASPRWLFSVRCKRDCQ